MNGGGYQGLDGGLPITALQALTGVPDDRTYKLTRELFSDDEWRPYRCDAKTWADAKTLVELVPAE